MLLTTQNTSLQKNAQEKLMHLIPFTDKELRVNDDGFFSESQQRRLKPKADLYTALSVLGAFFGFVVAIILFFAVEYSFEGAFLTAVCLGVFGVCFYGIFWSLGLSNKIKKGYGVKKVEGFAELFITYSGRDNNIPIYQLRVNEVKFRLEKEIYNAFEEGNYRVYYFPLLRNELLSLKPAGKKISILGL